MISLYAILGKDEEAAHVSTDYLTAFSTFLTDGFKDANGSEINCPETYSEFWSGHNLDDVKKIYKSRLECS